MATDRGFVQRIEVGRGGLVRVTVILPDASTAVFTIADLDADPERFNERLSKLAVLRDAMNRAEPVEIEHSPSDAGEEIDRAVRVSRDELAPPGQVDQVSGLVLDVSVHSENAVTAEGERHDAARIGVLTVDGTGVLLVLDLQAPERLVASQQLDMVRDAQARGALARFIVTTRKEEGTPEVLEVAVTDDLSAFGDAQDSTDVSGFVESLGLIPPPGGGAAVAGLALVGFTTAPAFTGPGNTTDPAAFDPQLLQLLVARSSATYELVEAGLRDNRRMRLAVSPLKGRTDANKDAAVVAGATDAAAAASPPYLLVLGAELLAPLASASRPVWVHIDRSMLDRGPEADCTPGVPSSDLSPRGLRDLRIPYPAQWRGLGCFNEGVYRFQLRLPGTFEIEIDGRELCLFDTDDPGVKVAYACAEGDHLVTVEIAAWTCDTDFGFDVYRVR